MGWWRWRPRLGLFPAAPPRPLLLLLLLLLLGMLALFVAWAPLISPPSLFGGRMGEIPPCTLVAEEDEDEVAEPDTREMRGAEDSGSGCGGAAGWWAGSPTVVTMVLAL